MKSKKAIAIASLGLLLSTSVFGASAANLKGRILLQVEQNGEAWYVSPSTEERTYMGRPNDAFSVMREQGVGITNDNIAKIPVGEKNLDTGTDSDGDGLSDAIEAAFGSDIDNVNTDNDSNDDKTEVLNGYDPTTPSNYYLIDDDFAESQAGKILLQVEQNGEAWYVNPDDNKRYFLGRPADAFSIMRELGLGISDENLEKVAVRNTNMVQSQTKQDEASKPEGEKPEANNGDATKPVVDGETDGQRPPADKDSTERPAMDGEEGSMPEGERGVRPAPQEAIDACNDLSSGDTCSFTTPEGDMDGTCQSDNDVLTCGPTL